MVKWSKWEYSIATAMIVLLTFFMMFNAINLEWTIGNFAFLAWNTDADEYSKLLIIPILRYSSPCKNQIAHPGSPFWNIPNCFST